MTASEQAAMIDAADDWWEVDDDDPPRFDTCEYCGCETDYGACPICNPYGDCPDCGTALEWYSDGRFTCPECYRVVAY